MATPYGTLFEDIRIALFNWLHLSINYDYDADELIPENDENAIPIFRADQDYLRPDGKLYVEYKFLTGLSKLGVNDELLNAPGNTFLLRGQREFTVTVNVLGNDAPEIAALIQQKLDSPVVHDQLRAAGLAVRNHETIADQTVFLETSDEDRAVIDVVFGIVLDLADAVTYIEQIELNSNLPGGGQSVVDIVD